MAQSEAGQSALFKAHCNGCRQTTNHRVLKSHVDTGSDDEQGFAWRTEYTMLECCGCNEVVLKREYWFSEDPGSVIAFFPPSASRWPPRWQWSLPTSIRLLLSEVYIALQANSLSLAMMGARAIIETAMITKVGDHGNFNSNLLAMEEAGHISKNNRKFLEVAVDAGSASAHRAHRPDAKQIDTVMDIVENLLHSLFVLEKQTTALKEGIPARPVVKKKKTSV